ncbi:MAG: T9SS type A sorting domain-containing protein [Bacteroidota bacterium]
MKQFYIALSLIISVLSYAQSNKTSLTCTPIITTTNPTAFGLCDGTITIDLTGCPSPPYVIQWLNTGTGTACQSIPLAESSYTGTIYTANTFCSCPTPYYVLIENSTGEQVGSYFPIFTPAPTGILELNNRTQVSIMPNPAQDVLHVNLKEINADARLDIKNVLGQVVLSLPLAPGNQDINITSLPNGVYLISLYSADKHVGFKKIVVQR